VYLYPSGKAGASQRKIARAEALLSAVVRDLGQKRRDVQRGEFENIRIVRGLPGVTLRAEGLQRMGTLANAVEPTDTRD
jgi:hypothetical protein